MRINKFCAVNELPKYDILRKALNIAPTNLPIGEIMNLPQRHKQTKELHVEFLCFLFRVDQFRLIYFFYVLLLSNKFFANEYGSGSPPRIRLFGCIPKLPPMKI